MGYINIDPFLVMCAKLGQVNNDNINIIPNTQCFSTITNKERERESESVINHS